MQKRMNKNDLNVKELNRENLHTIKLKENWLAEESIAHIHGWDFSHIKGRYKEEEDLPWNYKKIVLSYLAGCPMAPHTSSPDTSAIPSPGFSSPAGTHNSCTLLDIDTGGGEFLLSLNYPYSLTSATEGYPPNVELCKETLLPLGIDFREMSDYAAMPFADNHFDIIINRHGSYDLSEIYRTLKPGGIFITQQVGEDNDRELVDLLLPGTPKPFPGWNLANQAAAFSEQGFDILRSEEAFRPIRFYDVGALVWFARILEWEFPGFSVENCFGQLLTAQKIMDEKGYVEGSTHRFLIVAQKSSVN